MPFFIAIVLALLGSGVAQAQDPVCLSWDQPVTLRGYIIDGVFPGPPEYESVNRGDARYTAQFLYLDAPICVSGSEAPEAEPIASTELVQLACSETQVTAEMRGQTAVLSGKLFAQHTGYHRTPALLQCSQ